MVDGAGYFKTMISVMIPIARPSIIAVILFNFLAFWNEYIIALTLIPGPNKTLPVGLMNLMAAQKICCELWSNVCRNGSCHAANFDFIHHCYKKKLTQGMSLGGLKD